MAFRARISAWQLATHNAKVATIFFLLGLGLFLINPWPQQPADSELLNALDTRTGFLPRFSGSGPPSVAKGRLPILRHDNPLPRTLSRNSREQAFRILLKAETPEERKYAQRILESKLLEAPDSPESINDVAAILLLRYFIDQDDQAPAEALTLLDKAKTSIPPTIQIQFNRILALLALGQRHEARRIACQGYAQRPEGWNSAIIQRINSPTYFLSLNDPAARRSHLESDLGRWAATYLKSKDEGSKFLSQFELSLPDLATTEDTLLLDSLHAIRQKDPKTLLILATGHELFGKVRGDNIYSDCSQIRNLEKADRLLAISGTPFRGWSALDLAICAYHKRDFQSTNLYLDLATNIASSKAYLALLGRINWIRGLVQSRQGHFFEADASYRASISYFQKAREQGNLLTVQSLRTRNLERQGAREAAWSLRCAILPHLDKIASTQRRYDVLEEAFQAAISQNNLSLAHGFIQESLDLIIDALRRGEDVNDLRIFLLIARAKIYQSEGAFNLAEADYQAARSAWERLPPSHESKIRQHLELGILHAILADASIPRTTLAIDAALKYFSGHDGVPGDQLHVLDLVRLRAATNARHGEYAEAIRDFENGIKEIERQRTNTPVSSDRIRYLDTMQAFFEDKARFELDKLDDKWGALYTLERASQRALLDLAPEELDPILATRENFKNAISRIKFSYPAIRLSQLDDRLLIWTIYKDSLVLEQRKSQTRAATNNLVRSCRRSLIAHDPPDESRIICSHLEDLIFSPIRHYFKPGNPILIIPDNSTMMIPYPYLQLPYEANPIVMKHKLALAPSFILLLRLKQRQTDNIANSPLFVLTPTHSTKVFPNLPQLARTFLDSMLPASSNNTILEGEEAVKDQVLAKLPLATYFQFEGHTAPDPDDPGRSGLVLAPSTRERDRTPQDSILTTTDIAGLKLDHLRAAVLNGCQTARSESAQSEIFGVAEALLAKGGANIIVTTWPVLDSKAAPIGRELAKALLQGSEPSEALTQIQRQLIESPGHSENSPANWAGYEVFTGDLENLAASPSN